ncbi:hypothetical protein [Sphingomonas sp. M1-B02]|uniref:hypothetical protein n=1 Tax=Sphingomonas sp. M1-B02 TaxID=3114300 RepID=UPI00223F0954|nr:hypothetical protein [Sphingomonas sp. S6-11]UZK65529.1 hypothetical protein OKW87_13575 [Sphingomonas sp. S6-11]
MNWTELGGSLAAILVLAWIARLLKLGESRISDEKTAAEMAEEILPGFTAREALVSSDGSAALVLGNGAIALLKRHGAKVAARRMSAPLWRRPAAEGVTIETGERMFGPVTLLGVLPEDVARLESQLTVM